MSYDTVVRVIERTVGRSLVCAQTLCNWVQARAQEIDACLSQQIQDASALAFPALCPHVDLYDREAKEVLVLCDGIGVKAQKPTHEKAGQVRKEKPCQRHETEVMLFEGQHGSFRYLSGSSDKQVSVVQVADAFVRQEWGARSTPLPVVAITDGARNIRLDLAALFGECVTIVLDWYHLAKRVRENLSMVCHGRAEREAHEQTVLGFLWKGEVPQTLGYLGTLSARNKKALDDLIGYLQKHAGEIIDYGRRALTGKPLGSGRMEKAVDQVIGMRQKKKGMSWSAVGSHALALLKIVELNGQWQQLWART